MIKPSLEQLGTARPGTDSWGYLPLLKLAVLRTGAAAAMLWLQREGTLEPQARTGGTELGAVLSEQARSCAAARIAGLTEDDERQPWRAILLPCSWPAVLTLLIPVAADDDVADELVFIKQGLAAQIVLAEKISVVERDWRDEFTLVQRISGVGSWSWDMVTQEVRLTEKMHYLLGIQADGVKPSLAAMLARIAPEDRERLQAAIEEARATGRHFALEHDILHQDGARRTVSSHGRVVPSRDGPGQRVILTMQDLTDHIQLARALKAARAKAETQAETKTRLLAHISHEIRTPLNAVLGFADLLTRTALDARQRQHLGVIRETGALLLSVVNDLLDLAKIEAGRISIERSPFAIDPLLDAARATTEVLLGTKDVRFVLDKDQAMPAWLLGDAIRIKQILTNFLGNAAKFTMSGSITLRLRNLTPGASGRLRFEVVDTGIGIAPEQHEQLFRRFVQLGEDTNRRFGGTGLGLAICRELVELMEGSIGVLSNPDRGSTFWFELPLPEVSAPVQALEPAEPAAAAAPLNVLVVDDVETNRQLIQALLEVAQHRVSTANNGIEAITAVRAAIPDVVLMDVNMPELDGLEATRTIRGLGGAYAKLPIIALTARALPADIAACMDAGMNGYLGKPIDPHRLAQALAEAAPDRVAPDMVAGAIVVPSSALSASQLQGLAATIGAETLRTLFTKMLGRVATDCATMEAGLRRAEAAAVADAAHRLAGLCGSLGAPRLSETARAIETAAQERRLATCDPLLGELRHLAQVAAVEFTQTFGDGPSSPPDPGSSARAAGAPAGSMLPG